MLTTSTPCQLTTSDSRLATCSLLAGAPTSPTATCPTPPPLLLPPLVPPSLLPPSLPLPRLLLPPLLLPPLLHLPYCEQMAPVLAEAVIELTAAGGVAYLVSCATHAPWRDTCTLAPHMHASPLASSVAAAGERVRTTCHTVRVASLTKGEQGDASPRPGAAPRFAGGGRHAAMSTRARVRVGVRVGIRVRVGLRLRAQSSEWRKGLGQG